MKVVVITQEDNFFIPKNIEKVAEICDVAEIVIINSKGALVNKISDFYKWFGVSQFLKLGLKVLKRRILNFLDEVSEYRLMYGYCSVKSISKKHEINIIKIDNINSEDFYNHIRMINPALIISFSAPQVIKEPLLSYPENGILNVHGSLLPDYRGCLPSFWYLYNNEKYTGVTVHYMSTNIDDGDILLQEKISLEGKNTMFEVMNLTKERGGELIVSAINNILNKTTRITPNDASLGKYYTWPTIQQAKEFRKKGKRLI